MSLFPAYGQESAAEGSGVAEPGAARWDVPESELLASSDSEEEAPRAAPPPEPELDYYVDRRFDGGNLRVSTIYYPGRPQYNSVDTLVMGLPAVGGRRKRARRYWECPGETRGERGVEAEGEGERGAALRRALVERPQDQALWLQYIDYQEWACGAEAGLAAAEAAAARAPGAAAVRARRLAAARRALPPRDYLARLRDELAKEKDPSVAAELWCRLVAALAAAPEAGVEGAHAAAEGAVSATRRTPRAYPQLLYTYGTVLRAAGQWETLVLLLELALAAGAGAGADSFPPPRAPDDEQAAEERLQQYEDKVVSSGLPSGAVWARVERVRGATHWRPARPGVTDPDPARAPRLARVADLLLPVADPAAALLLPVAALRLAKVPLLPGTSYMCAAAGLDAAAGDTGEELLALVRAARRLPPPHAARAAPEHARRLVQLAVDPPHYFSDDYGFLRWVEALWAAALAGAGTARAALLAWRLRWLHALLLLLPESPESASEARRIRDLAQSSLKRWGGAEAAVFAMFARVAHAAEARGAGGAGAGRRAAGRALRAALRDARAPHHQLLYIARIIEELNSPPCSATLSAAGACALASAVLRRPPPADDARPAPDLMSEALLECERRCAALEEEMEAESEEEPRSLLACAERLRCGWLPSEAEWGAARVALATPARRAELRRRLLDTDVGHGRAGRWCEQQAAALALAPGGAAAAPELARRYPENVLLALLAGGASPLSPGARAVGPGVPRAPARLLALAWPALLRAERGGWEPAAAGELARCLRRLEARGPPPALLWALRLQAEAAAPRPRLQHAAHQVLDDLPHHKWLAVRCAALGAAGGGDAVADVLLERALRLHALPDELSALAPADAAVVRQ